MTKKTFLGVALLFLVAGGARGAITISLGTLAPEGTIYYRSLLEMREQWRKAPGGGVNLRIYGGGKMGGEAKMVSQLRLGALDAALLTINGLSDIDMAVTGLQSIPMMFRTLDEVDYIGTKMQPVMEQRMAKAGYVMLFWTDAGWTHFFSKHAIQTPDDLKKTKLFTWAGAVQYVEIWKSGGYHPVPLETADIVPMLDTGLINCLPMPPFAALTSQVYERTPHMLSVKWAPLVGGLVIRKKVWDKISAEAQAALLKASAEAGRANKAQARAESVRSIKVMQDKGLKVHPVTPELEEEWRRAAEPFYPRIKGTIIPPEIFDEVQQHLKEYRAAHGASKP